MRNSETARTNALATLRARLTAAAAVAAGVVVGLARGDARGGVRRGCLRVEELLRTRLIRGHSSVDIRRFVVQVDSTNPRMFLMI